MSFVSSMTPAYYRWFPMRCYCALCPMLTPTYYLLKYFEVVPGTLQGPLLLCLVSWNRVQILLDFIWKKLFMTMYASGKCGNEYFVEGAIPTYYCLAYKCYWSKRRGVQDAMCCIEGNDWSNWLMLGHFVFKNIRMFLRTNWLDIGWFDYLFLSVWTVILVPCIYSMTPKHIIET